MKEIQPTFTFLLFKTLPFTHETHILVSFLWLLKKKTYEIYLLHTTYVKRIVYNLYSVLKNAVCLKKGDSYSYSLTDYKNYQVRQESFYTLITA